MSKTHVQSSFNNNVRVEETVRVEPISNNKENTMNQPIISQAQLDAIAANAVTEALAAQAATVAAEEAKKAEAEKAAQAQKEAAEKSSATKKACEQTTPTNVVSRQEFEALKNQRTITVNHNWNPYGSDFNSNKSESLELDPWVVGGIAIGFVAVVAGIYYWVLKD